ncbi:MAG TPA: caspase family protein [Polyangia bacterium]|jgi:hypothetical protein
MTRRLLPLVLALALTPAAARAEAPPREEVFALVIGNNYSLDPEVRPLRYADDDAARVYELLSAVAGRAYLLTVLDAETQQAFPHLTAIARPPRLDALRAAMTDLAAAMRRARQAGRRTVLYFYFAGHGQVGADREGYLFLHDSRLTRSDLFREVIARSPADVNHVLIDACNAYYVVRSRGDGAPARAVRSFLAAESLTRYPGTGVIVSTNSAAETHEWGAWRSGLFSHQLLSALAGAADVDGDGRVTYQEVAAYITAANLNVRDPRARLAIYAQPPRADRRAALLDLARLRRVQPGEARPARGRIAGFLTLPEGMQGHYSVEDDRGVRYADGHKSAEQPLRLALLDRPRYHLRTGDREAVISLEEPGDVDADTLSFTESELRSRGSIDDSLRHGLYGIPFGRAFALGHTAAQAGEPEEVAAAPAAPVDEPGPAWYARRGTWKWTGVGLTVASLATGLTLQVLAGNTSDQLNGSGPITFAEAAALQRRASLERAGAGVALGVAGTAAVTTLVLFLLDHDWGRARRTSVGAAVAPGAAAVTFTRAF